MKTLQVRMNDELRARADAVLEDIGLDMPTAIRLYLKRIVQTRSIPFPLNSTDVFVEQLEVDDAVQRKMDRISQAWQERQA
jgi:addiction module RelB/DinJ family antitoxin